ncbi:hypothetical protein KNU09_gp67 [Gordonia phage TillyBobJoe]|uniref:Uncharacterized protein n=2 Tax=Wizardvirus TaxID=2169658 RepID=A0A5P8DA69_9CAUD|nr:hypothetical protein KNU09_gp67 [Gordonia phage TillyBobJoe]YP_010104284.1 hypothetical protein KNU74_gp70 [Gordonia phage Fireball]AXQ62298.1 hypothetical protein SEA_TILLYBOBJOE_67 [Gordonia phage TillyBobJoe]QFP95895.1 hypothetical protein SEA_FIREBALL_70 [Gordonia phage Fireball]
MKLFPRLTEARADLAEMRNLKDRARHTADDRARILANVLDEHTALTRQSVVGGHLHLTCCTCGTAWPCVTASIILGGTITTEDWDDR